MTPESAILDDMEILGTLNSGPDGDLSAGVVDGLGTDYLLASSPRRPIPATLKKRVLQRILAEPARVVTDADGHVTAINPAFSGLCGFSFEEIRGRKPGKLLQGEETDQAAVDLIRQAIREQASCVSEMVNYHKNGTSYRVRIEIEPLRDSSGRLTGFQAIETRLE